MVYIDAVNPVVRAVIVVAASACAGCAAVDVSKTPTTVSVSAANYSEVSGEDLYFDINGSPVVTKDLPPPPAEPAKPLFYGIVPGEIYENDLPVETVYRELATPLARRGYFNVVYQADAGLLPRHVDFLLRINFGQRSWRTPTVRYNRVTWGNSGLQDVWTGANGSPSAFFIGPEARIDSHAGLSPYEVMRLKQEVGYGSIVQDLVADNRASDYALVEIEAFRFEDVETLRNAAPCVWATFVAVPLHPGQTFSSVLHTMAQASTSYLGTTTRGLQITPIPPGKVILGEPKEVSPASRSPSS